MSHTEIGEDVLNRVVAQFKDKIVIDQNPKLEGRNMSMLISPKPGAFPKPQKEDKGKPRSKKGNSGNDTGENEGKTETENQQE